MFEREYRDLAHVPRWGILPVIRRQNVAEHSYYVTLYGSHICLALKLEAKVLRDTLLHCIEHDRSEVYTSDIPGPVKRATMDPIAEGAYEFEEDGKRFTSNKHKENIVAVAIRKMADLMDEYAYLTGELRMGNQMVRPVLNDVKIRLGLATCKVSKLTNNDAMNKVLIPFLQATESEKIMPQVENSDVMGD